MEKAKYDALMQCRILRMEYDFVDGVGTVCFPDKECCDFLGCVEWFKKIDKHIRCIITVSGNYIDTCYYLLRENGEWNYASFGLRQYSPYVAGLVCVKLVEMGEGKGASESNVRGNSLIKS